MKSSMQSTVLLGNITFCCLLCLCCNAAAALHHISIDRTTSASSDHSATWRNCRRGVSYRFVRYEASQWEQEALDKDACEQVSTGPANVATWLQKVQEYNAVGPSTESVSGRSRDEMLLHDFTLAVFSRYVYANVCPGAGGGANKYIHIPVEPLIGHMRHPYAACTDGVPEQVSADDKTYLLMNAWPSRALLANFPGKKYLLDLGSSTFHTSLSFFAERYGQAGVLFDEIWAWEMTAYEPTEYWATVPDDYKGRLHFFNTAFDGNLSSASNPLNIIRGLYRPGDMVVMKLDIDNAPLELSVIEAIENDPHGVHMIYELFFEMHYDHKDMAKWFGMSNGNTIHDVVKRLTSLREAGLNVHYWP